MGTVLVGRPQRRHTKHTAPALNQVLYFSEVTAKRRTARETDRARESEVVGRKGTVNHWSSESQEASAQGKKRVLENGLRPREAPWFPSVYQSSRKVAAITALNSYVHCRVPGSEHPGGGHFTRGRVLSSSPHWWALYFFTSAMYLAHASPLLVNTCGVGGGEDWLEDRCP